MKQVLYCQTEDKPVSRSELVKGFEYEKDRYVVVEQRELVHVGVHEPLLQASVLGRDSELACIS